MTALPVPESGPPAWREHRSGSPEVDELVRVLAVEQVDARSFTGTSTARPEGRIFGGQILAQALVSASLSTPGVAHSLHAYFMRAGRPRDEIRFEVDPLRDGRSFSTRRIDAVQGGEVICSVMASFHRPEEGVDHQDPMPDHADPDTLDGRSPFVASDGPARAGALEIRGCPAGPDARQRAESAVWMRITAPLPDDPLLHRALLAYLSDMSVLHGAFRRHGLRRSEVRTASLDHSLWLHRDGRADGWLLYDSRSPSAAAGRAVGHARLFATDGTLLATAGQEMTVRRRR
ncbi:MAG TPA: acyl-CoA thioesterase domain-containing protein [Pseudonocardia sp.]|nr:acyl-CoA thioesterase domain-containing protein [Pseudonocardia sp.]